MEAPAGCDAGPPKKSRPRSESAGFVALGGACCPGGGGLAPTVSVVVGLAGGVGSSPSMSIVCGGFCIGAGGWLDVEEARCEADRSSFAFSCTTLRGLVRSVMGVMLP